MKYDISMDFKPVSKLKAYCKKVKVQMCHKIHWGKLMKIYLKVFSNNPRIKKKLYHF